MDTQKIETETKMTNPPATETKMTAAKKNTVKMVKVVCQREFKIENIVRDSHGAVVEDLSVMVKPGQVVDVPEKRAEILCRKIEGAYAFSGERFIVDGDCKRHDLTIARRATRRDLVQDEELEPEEKVV